jgi:hypothetical protein
MRNRLRYLTDALSGSGLLVLALAVLAVPTQMSYADDPQQYSNCMNTCEMLSSGSNPHDPNDPEIGMDYNACMSTCLAASRSWCFFATTPTCDGWCGIGSCYYCPTAYVPGCYCRFSPC